MNDRPVTAVIFDLDGTVVQTRETSWRIFQDVSTELGLGIDTPEAFYDLFRASNFFDGIQSQCPDPDRARRAVERYLELLRRGYRPPIVPGMVDVVRTLASHATLCLVSSNSMEAVRRILLDNGIAHCFAHVFTAEVEPSKQRCIRRFLDEVASDAGRHCRPDYDEGARVSTVRPDEVALVTDTVGDVREALAAGIRAVGVTWGMHTEAELDAAGAEFVAIWPQELLTHLAKPGCRCATGSCAVDIAGETAQAPTAAIGDAFAPLPRTEGLWADVRAGRARRGRQVDAGPSGSLELNPRVNVPSAPSHVKVAATVEPAPMDPALLAAVERILSPGREVTEALSR
jgi:phosphoglycolate phosphatase